MSHRADANDIITAINEGFFTFERARISFVCTPLSTNSLSYIKVGVSVEVEGAMISTTAAAVHLDKVTIDDVADDCCNLDDEYNRDHDDRYDDDRYDFD